MSSPWAMKRTPLEWFLNPGQVFQVKDPEDSDHEEIFLVRSRDVAYYTLEHLSLESTVAYLVHFSDMPRPEKRELLFNLSGPIADKELDFLKTQSKHIKEGARFGMGMNYHAQFQFGLHPSQPVIHFIEKLEGCPHFSNVSYIATEDAKVYITSISEFNFGPIIPELDVTGLAEPGKMIRSYGNVLTVEHATRIREAYEQVGVLVDLSHYVGHGVLFVNLDTSRHEDHGPGLREFYTSPRLPGQEEHVFDSITSAREVVLDISRRLTENLKQQ